MSLVIVQHGQGAPDVLHVEDREIGAPGPGEVSLTQHAVGFNYLDLMLRKGIWPIDSPTIVPGFESAGVVTALGPGVTGVAIGDRVGYFRVASAYAAERTINAGELIRIPDTVELEKAAALLTKGLMAQISVKQAYTVKAGDVILVTTAAGGIGSLVTRWATALGANVIGVVGSDVKRAAALENGAVEAVVGLDAVGAVVSRLTGGRGVDAVLDGLGANIADLTASSVRPGGSVVAFGSAAGWPAPDLEGLRQRNVHFAAPQLGQYLRSSAAAQAAADDVFDALVGGSFGPQLPVTYHPLTEAALVHREVESRRATGIAVFIP